MFSKTALTNAAALLKNQQTVIVRSSVAAASTSSDKYVPRPQPDSQKMLENWGKAHALYNGSERDKVNFPDITRRATSLPTRLGFIPESVFEFFHSKTGVTGAYVFGIGAITFLLSKEIVVVEHNASEVIAFSGMVYIFSKKFGKSIGDYFAKQVDDYEQKHWTKPFEQSKSNYKDSITANELAISQEAGQQYLYQAKKENVAIQLESVYRSRLNEVAQAVKNRLNYQLEVESSKRQYEQRHMVNWITDSVVKGITPQQEKDTLAKCLLDLEKLAVKA